MLATPLLQITSDWQAERMDSVLNNRAAVINFEDATSRLMLVLAEVAEKSRVLRGRELLASDAQSRDSRICTAMPITISDLCAGYLRDQSFSLRAFNGSYQSEAKVASGTFLAPHTLTPTGTRSG